MNSTGVPTRDLLNAQAGKIGWAELARHFARGAVVLVDGSLDLIECAELLVQDGSASVETLVAEGTLHRANDDDAISWHRDDSELWAVVVAPWVLVQEISTQK